MTSGQYFMSLIEIEYCVYFVIYIIFLYNIYILNIYFHTILTSIVLIFSR